MLCQSRFKESKTSEISFHHMNSQCKSTDVIPFSPWTQRSRYTLVNPKSAMGEQSSWPRKLVDPPSCAVIYQNSCSKFWKKSSFFAGVEQIWSSWQKDDNLSRNQSASVVRRNATYSGGGLVIFDVLFWYNQPLVSDTTDQHIDNRLNPCILFDFSSIPRKNAQTDNTGALEKSKETLPSIDKQLIQ